MVKQTNGITTKRISQVYLDYPVTSNIDGELVNITLPLTQVVSNNENEGTEENLTVLNWKVVE